MTPSGATEKQAGTGNADRVSHTSSVSLPFLPSKLLKFQNQLVSRAAGHERPVTSEALITNNARTKIRINSRNRVTQHCSNRKRLCHEHVLGL